MIDKKSCEMSIMIPLVEIGLTVIGAWPGVPVKKFFIVLLGIYLSSLTFQVTNLILVFDKLDLLMSNFATTMPVMLVVLKLSMFRLKYRSVKILITEMLEDWKSEKNADVRQVMVRNAKLASVLSNIITICYNGLVIAFVGIAAVSYKSKSIEDRQFVIQTTYPINAKKSPLFEIVCLWQFVVAFFVTNGHAVLEGLLTLSVLHANTKAFSVSKEISNYTRVCLTGDSEKHILKAKQELIKKHLEFIHFTDCIQDIFSNVSFFHLFIMSLINCTVGFMFISIDTINRENIFTLLMCISYMFTALSAVLAYCAAGEYLSSQGTAIFQKLCECNWYNFKTSDIKILTFMIMRSRKPVTITAGSFGVLSLIYFTKIIKTSFSYLSLARASIK